MSDESGHSSLITHHSSLTTYQSQQEESNLGAAVLQTAGMPDPSRLCRHVPPLAAWRVPPSRKRQRKERESNPQGSRSAAFEAAAIAHWLALPLTRTSTGRGAGPAGSRDPIDFTRPAP